MILLHISYELALYARSSHYALQKSLTLMSRVFVQQFMWNMRHIAFSAKKKHTEYTRGGLAAS
jgi:hypothetical protein